MVKGRRDVCMVKGGGICRSRSRCRNAEAAEVQPQYNRNQAAYAGVVTRPGVHVQGGATDYHTVRHGVRVVASSTPRCESLPRAIHPRHPHGQPNAAFTRIQCRIPCRGPPGGWRPPRRQPTAWSRRISAVPCPSPRIVWAPIAAQGVVA